ncbi:hypothetical protein ACQ5SO_00655 [Rhodovulum sp. DZ06]|uniref:hypothetical protein n=1 Tax=Rhodovulum sp. DZ06 TaxID=3425126 RepID=UPI003D339FDC
MASSSGSGRRSRSIRRSAVTATIVSVVIVGGAVASGLLGGGGGVDNTDIRRLYTQISELQQKTDRLEESLTRMRFEMEAVSAGGPRAELIAAVNAAQRQEEEAARAAEEAAPESPEDAEARRRELLSSEGLAAAAISALEDREAVQKRLLIVMQPDCAKPDADGLVVCRVNLRNNAISSTAVSFSQSGSAARIEGGDSFSSIRMRQPGQPVFGYTTALNIAPQSVGTIEIAFGPVEGPAETVSRLSIAANKSVYSFEGLALK